MKSLKGKLEITKTKTKISLVQKQKICKYKLDHPEKSQKELSIYFSQLFKTTIGRSTIGDILRDSYKWTHTSHLESSHFEELLLLRISNQRSDRPTVNKNFLIDQIKDLSKKLNLDEGQHLDEEFIISFLKKYKLSLENEKNLQESKICKLELEDSESFDDFLFFTDLPEEEKSEKSEELENQSVSRSEEEKYLTHIQALKNTKILTEYFKEIQYKQGEKFMNKLDQDIEESIFCCKSLEGQKV